MEQFLFFSALTVSCLFATIRGGRSERIGALLLGAAAVLSAIVAGRDSMLFAQIEWGLFAVDIFLFLALVALALSADRYWPMWLSSLQLAGVWMHPAFGFSQYKIAYAYAIASIFWSYPMMLILIIGTTRYNKRRRAKT